MGSEDQALIVHSKKSKRRPHYPKGKDSHLGENNRRDISKLRCYTCDERGHFAKDCPNNKVHSQNKKGNKRRHHAHVAEDDEPSKKKTKYESEDSSNDDQYVLISALMGNITHGSIDWLIDSGASNHMKGFKKSFVKLSEHE